MSTRSTTHFMSEGDTEAIVYRHSGGYPEGHGADLSRFFDDIEAQTKDTRYDDPSYLAAKLIVWLADGFARSAPLDFLGVGVVQSDPSDIEYLYEIDCTASNARRRPVVRCFAVDHSGGWQSPIVRGREVPIHVAA